VNPEASWQSGRSDGSAEAITITGRSLRGTARACDSSASGCRASQRVFGIPEPFAQWQEPLMSAREESRSEKRAKARKVAEQKRVLEAVS
jgi:hypothetical protein